MGKPGEVSPRLVLLDPTNTPDRPQEGRLAMRPDSLMGKRLALVDNRKNGSAEILAKLAAHLQASHGVGEVRVFKKPSASKPVDPDLVREIAGAADLAVAGIGD